MSDETRSERVRDRLTLKGEDALGKFAQDLLENPLINGALNRALEAREKAAQAQEVAMGALNLPSASDIERLTRRVRQISQRLEGIEDVLDRVEESLARANGDATDQRLVAIEAQLETLSRQVGELHDAHPDAAAPMPRGQERLRVDEDAAAVAPSTSA
jgi:hypothetical protein